MSVMLLVSAGACTSVIQLPGREPPAAALPSVRLPKEPPAQTMGRLVIDVVDGPMHIDMLPAGATPPDADPALLQCITPCVRDLPLGAYDLFFSNVTPDERVGDKLSVELTPGTHVIRHAPSIHRTAPDIQPFPDLLATIGGLFVIGSVGSTVSSHTEVASPVILSLGSAMLLYGLLTHRYAAEEQAGATTRFSLDPSESTPRM
jgi:hypothetical protein